MPPEEQGQLSDSPTDETKTGQETASPPVDDTQQIIDAAKKEGETAAPTGEEDPEKKAEPGTEEKPPPYDQDPKWLAARAAEKSLNEILEEHGFDNKEELTAMLRSGMTLVQILGDRDAQQLIKDADTLKAYQEHWAAEERRKQDEELEPDERADKYKKELEDLKAEQAAKETAEKHVEESKQAIINFDTRVGNFVDKQDLGENEAEMAKLFLGVKNPFNEVDIFDNKAINAMAESGIERFKTFIKDVKQQAIDEYVAGKSDITPISKTETPDKTDVVPKKKYADDASPEEVFAAARDELLEAITGGSSV